MSCTGFNFTVAGFEFKMRFQFHNDSIFYSSFLLRESCLGELDDDTSILNVKRWGFDFDVDEGKSREEGERKSVIGFVWLDSRWDFGLGSRWGFNFTVVSPEAASKNWSPNSATAFFYLLHGFPIESDPAKLVRCWVFKNSYLRLSKTCRGLSLLTFIFCISFPHLLACCIFSYFCDFNFLFQLESDMNSFDLFEQIWI